MPQLLDPDSDSGHAPDADAPLDESTCPSCDDDIINVQGILACAGCSWVESQYR